MKKILVTGASGFIGRSILPMLRESSFDIHAVSRRLQGHSEGISWHRTDLLDSSAVSSLLQKIRATHLLHLAWITDPDFYRDSQDNFLWLEASKNLFRGFHKAGGHRV